MKQISRRMRVILQPAGQSKKPAGTEAPAGGRLRGQRNSRPRLNNYNTPASGFRPLKSLALRTYIRITFGSACPDSPIIS
jgi:hypothetical protein